MVKQWILLGILAVVTVFSSCRKEEDPFEYPDGEITEPYTVTHMTRVIDSSETWMEVNTAVGCSDSFPVNTFAFTELNRSRGFATMYLVPDSSICSPLVSLETSFEEDEIPSDYWDNWKLEFTFSELQLNSRSEFRFQFDFREVSLDLDLAPFMRETIATDSLALEDISGVFVFEIEQGFTNFYLNGINWSPDFSEGSGNTLIKDASIDEPRMKLTMKSENTDGRSLIVFNFLRVTTFGIPEQ